LTSYFFLEAEDDPEDPGEDKYEGELSTSDHKRTNFASNSSSIVRSYSRVTGTDCLDILPGDEGDEGEEA